MSWHQAHSLCISLEFWTRTNRSKDGRCASQQKNAPLGGLFERGHDAWQSHLTRRRTKVMSEFSRTLCTSSRKCALAERLRL